MCDSFRNVDQAVVDAKGSGGVESLEKVLSDENGLLRKMYDCMEVDDPLVCVKWNPEWEALHPEGRTEVCAFFGSHGGSDQHNSTFLWHFRTFQDLHACRDEMKSALPFAFHSPADAAAVPLGEMWIVEPAGDEGEDLVHGKDEKFFCV